MFVKSRYTDNYIYIYIYIYIERERERERKDKENKKDTVCARYRFIVHQIVAAIDSAISSISLVR